MDSNSLNNFDTTNTYDHYDAFFQPDYDRYMRDYESYQHYMSLCEQEAGGSSSDPIRRRRYIYREREEAEERLIDDYFGDDEYEPKYPEETFRRSSRLDATGRKSIGPILKCTSAIRQLAYGTAPDAFDEYLQIAERTSRECLDNFTKCIHDEGDVNMEWLSIFVEDCLSSSGNCMPQVVKPQSTTSNAQVTTNTSAQPKPKVKEPNSMLISSVSSTSVGPADASNGQGQGKKFVSAGSSSSVSAGYIIEFMLEDLEAIPVDYVPAGHVLISADRYKSADLIYRQLIKCN
ncbi:hypothetical protein Tco_1499717 [Tanacetum coccineum]